MKISNNENTTPTKNNFKNNAKLDDSKDIAPSTSGKPSVIHTLQQNITKAKQGIIDSFTILFVATSILKENLLF